VRIFYGRNKRNVKYVNSTDTINKVLHVMGYLLWKEFQNFKPAYDNAVKFGYMGRLSLISLPVKIVF